MDALVIRFGWEYFLGVMGALLAIACYTQGRFSAVESDVSWLKEALNELTIKAENVQAKLFESSSPFALTSAGYIALKSSGLRSYIDANRNVLLAKLKRAHSDPYELQRHAFRLLADLPLEDAVFHHMQRFAFTNDLSTELLRRVGGIYLRDIAASSK